MALQTHSGIESPVGFSMLGWGGVTSEDPIFAAVPIRETDHLIEPYDPSGAPQDPIFESDFTPQVPVYVEV